MAKKLLRTAAIEILGAEPELKVVTRERETFLRHKAVVPLREVVWNLSAEWDGKLTIPKTVAGCYVKPVVNVPEERAELVDRAALREALLAAKAVAVRDVVLNVSRRRAKREERHAVDLPLRESLELFAQETRARDAKAKIAFAESLAVEADEGATE